MDWIQTYKNLVFDYNNISSENINIYDIAHALSNICRFGGHTIVPYSVAEHSIRCAELLYNESIDTQLWGLLHDAAEAYIGDIPTPLKKHLLFQSENYSISLNKYEEEILTTIAKTFNLSPTIPIKVKEKDRILLITEARDLLPSPLKKWQETHLKPLKSTIVPWSSFVAEQKFITKYIQLRKSLNVFSFKIPS